MDVKSTLTQGHRARWAAGTKANLTLQGYLDDHATDHRRGVWENKPASWIALAVGIVLIAGAVFLSMRRLASDVLTTVAGIAGFLAICYGLVIQVMALLNNRERDE